MYKFDNVMQSYDAIHTSLNTVFFLFSSKFTLSSFIRPSVFFYLLVQAAARVIIDDRRVRVRDLRGPNAAQSNAWSRAPLRNAPRSARPIASSGHVPVININLRGYENNRRQLNTRAAAWSLRWPYYGGGPSPTLYVSSPLLSSCISFSCSPRTQQLWWIIIYPAAGICITRSMYFFRFFVGSSTVLLIF